MANNKAEKMDGRKLLIFVDGKALALTTDTSISLKADTYDSSSKDDGAEGSMDISKCSWSASNDSFFSVDSACSTAVVGDVLMEKFWAKAPIEVVIGTPTNMTDAEVGEGGWSAPTMSNGWKGKAIISALDIKATVGQKATCTLNLEGIGHLEKLAGA